MIIIGLDIGKYEIDAYIDNGDSGQYRKVENNPKGWQELISFIRGKHRKKVHVCCEYTGVYYLGVATAFYKIGCIVSVVNPAVIRYYAMQELARNKTDKQDAILIASYCREKKPAPWTPPTKQNQRIRALTRRVEQLTKMRTMEMNRLKVAQAEDKETHQGLIDWLEKEIGQFHAKLKALVKQDITLQEKQKLMTTIPGIGEQTATAFLSLVSDIDRFPSAKHFVSYLGLSPRNAESGTSVKRRTRITKMGDRYMRKLLYMPARSACLRSKVWRDWAQRQMQNGKHPKVVYVIMMRKLATYIYKVITTNQPFDKSVCQVLEN